MFDYTNLSKLILDKFGTYAEFARSVATSKSLVSQKLDGSVSLSSKDIFSWANALSIKSKDIGSYFFTLKV